MKKFFAFIMVVCMMLGVVMEHSYAALQQSNVSYVTENKEEVKFQQVAAGSVHSLGLSKDGTVYSWGNNENGQLGDGTLENKSIPIPIINNVKFIAAGYDQSFAITKNNELYAWGRNGYGQLSDGTTINQSKPIKVMENVQSVSAGYNHTLILTTNGEVYGVGRNYLGSLGQGSVEKTILIPVKILDNIQKIDVEYDHSMVLTKDGIVYDFGTFGTNFPSYYQPTKMMENVKEIASGSFTSFAVTENNELYGWGTDVGLGHYTLMTNIDIRVPKKLYDNVLTLSACVQVLLLDMDNNLITWGYNGNGELGNGSTKNSAIPSQIMKDMICVEAQGRHSLAISNQGELYVWGLNDDGMLGNGLTSGNMLTPTKIQVIGNVPTPRIEFDTQELTLALNTTTPINATVYNSTTTEATWRSSDPNIATVTDTGEVTTVGIGTAQITMTTGDGITNSCTIIVTEADTPTPESPILSLLLEVGEGARLSVSQDLGDNIDMTWSSTDNDIARVDSNGYITAHSEGIVRVYAENDTDSFYINVKVIASGTADEYRLAVDLQAGQTARLYLSDSENITWSSMDNSIATIDTTGKVTAVSEGLAIMQAELDGNTYIIYVRVR